jgi:hypothetical protein
MSAFSPMPKYYFNVHNVTPRLDGIGEELLDDAAAWHEGTVIAGELFKEIDASSSLGRNGA